jgi:hypothetical protein
MWGFVDHESVVKKALADSGYIDASTDSTHPNRRRKQAAAKRLRLYKNNATFDHEVAINNTFATAAVRAQRKQLIPVAMYQNVTARIVDEVASLYDGMAARAHDVPAYLEAVKASRWPHIARRAQHYLFLLNHVLLWHHDAKGPKTRFRIVTPDMFSIIADADDDTHMAGVLMDRTAPNLSGVFPSQTVTLELWDDTYRYLIGPENRIVSMTEHGLPRIPGILMHLEEPVGGDLLEMTNGDDIISAHQAVVLLNVMILRLAKSQGERQPILTGDGANIAVGQVSDGETPLVIPQGTTAQMLESVTHPDHYLATKKDVLTAVAQTYGLSYEALSYTDDMSGRAFNARRQKLKELRDQQRTRALEHEQQICELLGYSPKSLKVDFTEQTIPLDAIEEVGLLEQRMRLGIDSAVSYLMRKDPDLTRAEAIELVRLNIGDRAEIVRMMTGAQQQPPPSVGNADGSALPDHATSGAQLGTENQS